MTPIEHSINSTTMKKTRPPEEQTAEEYLASFDRKQFLSTREDQDPENWDFQIGYYEAAGKKAYQPDSEDWFVLAIYKPSITPWKEATQNQASVIILRPGRLPCATGHGHQDKNSIWMWDTD